MNPAVILAVVILLIMAISPFVVLHYWRKARELTRRADYLESLTFVLLSVDVPRHNDKTPLSAEQFFSALHGILRDDPVMQEHVSFEVVATAQTIQFYIFLPVHLQEFVEGQIYAQYPDVHIAKVEDYARATDISSLVVAQTSLKLAKEDVYPIRTFNNFDVDPLAGITAVLSKLAADEQIWLQLVVKPIDESWQKRGLGHIKMVRSGGVKKSSGPLTLFGRLIMAVFREVVQPGSSGSGSGGESKPVELPGPVTEALAGIENKVTKLGFVTVIRVVAISGNESASKTRVQSVVGAFKQFSTTNMNGFGAGDILINDQKEWTTYLNRSFEEKGYVFNTEELASLYHFPSESVATPNLRWAGAKKGEAPANLPIKGSVADEQITVIGKTDFRNSEREFGIKLIDRMQHTYVIGKSGGGKSKLLLNMIRDDVIEGRGVIVVDPHGELAEETMAIVPKERLGDTIVFDPSDRDWPIAFNLLEQIEDDFKGMVASGFVGIFKKIFGYSWGPRLEHILRNTVLALLDYPDSTMLSIPRMLTERAFRETVIDHIKDPVISDFWINEFGSMDNKFATEAVSPILNKVGQFLSTPTIRNIVGQKRSAINIRQVMDEQKILIINLSRGKIGEDNAALMGSMMITKVQLAAMSRADTAPENRPPVFLYVDEFQNFATESFAVILSEARKYGLGLTLAHQYIAQMPEEVRDAVFGNVGTIISFRVGAADSESLVREFAPVFDAIDLVNLEKYHIYIKLLIDGLAAPSFSAVTLPPPTLSRDLLPQMLEHTRQNFASRRLEVEEGIEQWSGIKEKLAARQAAKEAGSVLRAAQAPRPTAAPAPMPAPRPPSPPTDEAVGQGSGEKTEPYTPKLLKAIGTRVYKEHTQRGGQKWYIGEPLDLAVGREQDRLKRALEKEQQLKNE